MKSMEALLHPSARQLRQFGAAAWVALPLAACVWTRGSPPAVLEAAAAGGLIAALGWLWPRSLTVPFVALGLLAWPIGRAVQELLLGLMFFAVFVPMGLAFRLLGRDALQRRFDPRAATYWQPKPQAKGAASYFRRW
jgi:hypothetical protein